MNEDFQRSWDEQAAPVQGDTGAAAPGAVGLKQIVTIRLDVDVLNWFKAQGPGYQTRINKLLREQMEAQRNAAQS